MRSIATVILSCFVLSFVPTMLFSGDLSWDMALYCRDMQVCIVTSFSLLSLPKHQVSVKTVCLVFLLYCVVEAHLYLIQSVCGYSSYESAWYVYTALLSCLYLYNRYKQFNFKSDKINPENITLCFWKPKNGITLTASLIGLPFGGLCIYADGHLYGYRWGRPTYQREKRDPKSISRCFTVVDTGFKSHSVLWHLDGLVGTSAGRPRIRCILTIKPILNLIGGKFSTRSVFDLIPAHYAHGILGNGQRHSDS